MHVSSIYYIALATFKLSNIDFHDMEVLSALDLSRFAIRWHGVYDENYILKHGSAN